MKQSDAQILAEMFSAAIDKDISEQEAVRIAALMKIFFKQGVDGFEKNVEIRKVFDKDEFLISIPVYMLAAINDAEALNEVYSVIETTVLTYSLKTGPQGAENVTYRNYSEESVNNSLQGQSAHSDNIRYKRYNRPKFDINSHSLRYELPIRPDNDCNEARLRNFHRFYVEPAEIMAESRAEALSFLTKKIKLVQHTLP